MTYHNSLSLSLSLSLYIYIFKKIPVRDLRATEKHEIIELAVIMKMGKCPYIVEFYGCLIRDVHTHAHT